MTDELANAQLYMRNGGSGCVADTSPPAGRRVYELGEPLMRATLVPQREPAPGRRIAVISYSYAEGGASMLDGRLYDADRQTDCSVVVAADGKRRCLPSSPPLRQLQLFTDDGCTQSISITSHDPPQCGLPSPSVSPAQRVYFGVRAGSPDSDVIQLYERGAQYTGKLYTGMPTKCSVYSGTPNVFRFTEIPFTDFAEAVEEIDP